MKQIFNADTFQPPLFLRQTDLQNVLSSTGFRTTALQRRAGKFFDTGQTQIIDCGNGVRLMGELNQPATDSQGLVVLLHGWEGCSRSAYVLSAAITLYQAGYTVFRLNFRDHGDSHHLNKGLFNSTLLDEVIAAIRAVQNKYNASRNFLAGYSLGGNFALRSALFGPKQGVQFNHVAAICPVIDPHHAMHSLENGRFFYHNYFVKKWQTSLLKKLQYFPDYDYQSTLLKLRTLRDMHDFFVPNFTGFPDRVAYFDAYKLNSEHFRGLTVPTTIISSRDDPIIRYETLPATNISDFLDITVTEHGSHCAFLKNWRMESWIDDNLVQLFSRY